MQVQATPTNEKITFSFGENWKDFVDQRLDPQREQIALQSVQDILRVQTLENRTFMDVGCGSGLFSLAAYRLGATRIISLDVDPYSVKATEQLRSAVGAPPNWSVHHGSILDKAAIGKLGQADVVYAWGSLHHTGSMWEAIRNAASLVAPGGLFLVGIYNRTTGRGSSEYWLKVKDRYNRRSTFGKRVMEVTHVLRYQVLPEIIRFRSPFAYARNYNARRGMDRWIDVRDWLGGLPYEYASPGEIFAFCHEELGMTLVNLKTVNDIGVNEFVFKRLAVAPVHP